MNLIGEADVKVDSEEFCNANDDQSNYDGNKWIIVCSQTFLCCIDFIVAIIIYFITIFSFLSNMDHFIQLYLFVFFGHAEEMASVYVEIDVKDESLFPSLEYDQVCSEFFMTLMFTIDYHRIYILIIRAVQLLAVVRL